MCCASVRMGKTKERVSALLLFETKKKEAKLSTRKREIIMMHPRKVKAKRVQFTGEKIKTK